MLNPVSIQYEFTANRALPKRTSRNVLKWLAYWLVQHVNPGWEKTGIAGVSAVSINCQLLSAECALGRQTLLCQHTDDSLANENNDLLFLITAKLRQWPSKDTHSGTSHTQKQVITHDLFFRSTTAPNGPWVK